MSKQGYIYNKSTNEETATILINGEIDSWWGIGLESFAKDIANTDAKEVMLQINSGGGSVTEGTAIAAYIKGSPSNIKTSILGLCASIATTIAIAGKTTSIAKGSLFMIHNASGGTWGGSEDMRKTADLLDTIDLQLTNLYLDTIKANGKLINDSIEETKAQLIEWQNEEKWFTAEQAVEHGFIQKLVEGVEFSNKAQAQNILNSCSKYKNVPTDFINNIQNIVNMADEKPAKSDELTTKGILDTVKGWFKTAEGKEEIAQVVKNSEDAKKTALENAKALLEAEGLQVTAKATEAPAPETPETSPEPVAKTKIELLTEQLAAAKAENQALEEANGAPAAKAKEKEAAKKSGFSAEQDAGFEAIANQLKKLG